MKGNREKNFLIVGVGNPFRGDDSAGVLVARFFKRCFGERVKVIGVEIAFDELIQILESYDLVILIDAIKSEGKPGEIYRFRYGIDKIPVQLGFFSTHSVGLIEYVEIARVLGKLPGELIIYGIVGKDFNVGSSISREVKVSCKKIVREILSEIGV